MVCLKFWISEGVLQCCTAVLQYCRDSGAAPRKPRTSCHGMVMV